MYLYHHWLSVMVDTDKGVSTDHTEPSYYACTRVLGVKGPNIFNYN